MNIIFFLFRAFLSVVICFLPGSHVIPTLKLIGVGGLLPRMIFHRLEPMFDYPREMGYPYIYIYCISISRVFWRFLTFFDDFWFLSIFCALWPCFLTFFDGSFPSLRYSHFWFFPYLRDGIDFFVFWPFFLIDTFFGSFYFLWILFLDRWIFYRFFIVFWFFRFLSNVASVGRPFFGF